MERKTRRSSASDSPKRKSYDAEERDVDGGWAWVVLVSSFIVNSISLGTNFSFAVYLVEFDDYFGQGKSRTAVLISLAGGLVLCAGPFASISANRYGARIVIIIGSLITALGYILSAFVPRDKFWAMFITFSIMTGVGSGLSYTPSFGVLPLYFKKRRNFATAFVTAGNGVGIFIFSNLFRYLIDLYGWRGAMFISAGIALHIIPCGMVIFKRQPAGGGFAEFADLSLFKEAAFYLSLLHFFTMGAYFIFIVLCIKFAQVSVGVSKEEAPLLLTVHGATNLAGRWTSAFLSATKFFGKTNNRFILSHILTACVGLSLAFYPFCTDFKTICVGAAFTGFAWGSKFALVPGLNLDVFSAKRFNSSWGYLVFVLGLAFLIFPPLGSAISELSIFDDFAYAFYFGGLVSALALASGIALHYLMIKRSKTHAGDMEMDRPKVTA